MMDNLLNLWAILDPKRARRIPKWWALFLVALAFALSWLIFG